MSQEGCNLFVAGISGDINDEALSSLFKPYGTIVSAKIMRDLQTGASRNFGFVLMDSKDCADAAIKALHGKKLGVEGTPTSTLFVTHATHDDSQNAQECERLYVRNIPNWVTGDDLNKVFSAHGRVVEVSVLPDPQRPSMNRGVGFVRFASVEEAREAISKTHNMTPWGSNHALLVRFMESNQMRQSRQLRKGQKKEVNSLPNSITGSPKVSPQEALSLGHSTHLGTSQGASSPQVNALFSGPVALGATPFLLGSTNSLNGSGTESTRLGTSQQLAASGTAQFLVTSGGSTSGSGPVVRRKNNAPKDLSVSPSKPGPGLTSILPSVTVLAPGASGPGLATILTGPAPTLSPSPSTPVLLTPLPFPTLGDLFFQGIADESFLHKLVAPWGDIRLMTSVAGGIAVRLTDMSQHMAVAQTLNAATLPSGTVIVVAVIA